MDQKGACDINYVSAKNNTVQHTMPLLCTPGWKYVICHAHQAIPTKALLGSYLGPCGIQLSQPCADYCVKLPTVLQLLNHIINYSHLK